MSMITTDRSGTGCRSLASSATPPARTVHPRVLRSWCASLRTLTPSGKFSAMDSARWRPPRRQCGGRRCPVPRDASDEDHAHRSEPACIVRSRAAPQARSRDLIRSRDMLSRPPFGQSVRSTALAKLPVTHPRPTLTCVTRSTMIPPRSPQSRARRPAHGDGTATGSASRQRHTLPPDPPPPKGQRVTRLPRPLPRPCRQALFRQVDACLS